MARTTFSDNFLAYNKGLNPLVNFNFVLRVELALDLPCKSVKAFTREMEYEFIQEGGLNDYVHMRRKPISRPFTLEVERYAGVDYFDPLPLGAELMLPLFLIVSRFSDKFEKLAGVARTYAFTGCTVTKKVYGELVGDRSGILTDTITIAYREMVCIDTPFTDLPGGAIVGGGKSNTEAWTQTKEEIDRGNAERLRTDIDQLQLRQQEQAEINRKHLEEIARQRARRVAEIEQLNEEIKRLSELDKARRDEILAARTQARAQLDALDAELRDIDRQYDAQLHANMQAQRELEAAAADLRRKQAAFPRSAPAEAREELERQLQACQEEMDALEDARQQLQDAHKQQREEKLSAQQAERAAVTDTLRGLAEEEAALNAEMERQKAPIEAELAEKQKELDAFEERAAKQTEANNKRAENIENEIADKQQKLDAIESTLASSDDAGA